MIDYFRDESVGLVSGEDRYYNPAGHGTNEGQGFYIRYEMALRRLESKFGSTVSASGCFYAVRANLRGELTAEQIDDLAVPMKVIRAGKRIISAGDAVAWYPGVDSPEKEFQRRIRMVVGGIRSMFANLDVIEPIHHARFSFQFISHKLLRWLVPFFMLIAFLSSAILAASHTLFLLIFGSQIAFYFLALLGHRIRHSRKLPKAISIPYFFCGSNYCVLLAWIKLFQGARFVTWEPSRS
jgi:cellulose synthase/poly-beta-1,6-N-acetylglucosamine synthase-like glycosyltransferase